MISRSALLSDVRPATYARLLLWLALAISQMLAISLLYDFTVRDTAPHNPVFFVTRLARWAAVSFPIFVLLSWSERRRLAEQWAAVENQTLIGRPLVLNLVVFALTAMASAAFTAHAATAITPPWAWLLPLGALLAAMSLTLLQVLVPLRGLVTVIWTWRGEAALAASVALGVVVLADISTQLWHSMAGATLLLSAEILKLYETNVVVDMIERGIRVGDFGALIGDACSGSEGLVLVTGFLSIYLWAFRKQLRFPHALILFPIGLAASWLLNSVRIAALVSIGAHVSPEMAVKGFHSQAGWIAFLGIALGIMALSHRFGLVSVSARSPAPSAPAATAVPTTRYDATVGYLMPFVALMVGSIAMSVAAPHDRPVYALKAGLVMIALWMLRKQLGSWRLAIPGTSITAGILVGAAWIATAPAPVEESNLGAWLQDIGPMMAITWLAIRGLGTIVLVPIAEELAFRGYLYRRLIHRDFHLVGWTAFSWIALVVSSAAFGILHERWLAGGLAGAVFALLMLRGGRLGDAILGHAIANALIFGWALAFKQWSLI